MAPSLASHVPGLRCVRPAHKSRLQYSPFANTRQDRPGPTPHNHHTVLAESRGHHGCPPRESKNFYNLAQELQQLVEQSDESPRDEKMVRRHHKTANKPRSRRARPPAPPPPPPPRRAAAPHLPLSHAASPPPLSQVEAILQALQQDVEAAGQIGVPTAGGSGSGGHASPLGAAPFGGVEEYDEEERYRSVPPSQQAGIARLRRSLSAPGPNGMRDPTQLAGRQVGASLGADDLPPDMRETLMQGGVDGLPLPAPGHPPQQQQPWQPPGNPQLQGAEDADGLWQGVGLDGAYQDKIASGVALGNGLPLSPVLEATSPHGAAEVGGGVPQRAAAAVGRLPRGAPTNQISRHALAAAVALPCFDSVL